MSSRHMSLLPRAALRSGSEQHPCLKPLVASKKIDAVGCGPLRRMRCKSKDIDNSKLNWNGFRGGSRCLLIYKSKRKNHFCEIVPSK